jgi:nucleoside-diphosphate-sugar epimerase
MKVLVTGASGFLGSHVVDKCIEQGFSVRVFARRTSNLDYLKKHQSIDYVYGDLTDPVAVRNAVNGVDTVIHSAARVTEIGDREQFYADNFHATTFLLDAAKSAGVRRFVFVSSPSIFFDQTDQNNIDESYPYPATYINLYSESKALAEQYVLAANSNDFVTCSLRPRAVWGPRDKTGYMPKIVYALMQQKFPDISAGKTVYANFCYVENAADACVQAAQSDQVGGKAYFITDDEVVNSWEFLNLVREKFQLPPIQKKISPRVLMFLATVFDLIWTIPALARKIGPPISRYSVGLLILNSTYNISAAKRDFGYDPKVKQSEGLQRLSDWINEIGGLEKYVAHVKK